MMKNDIEVLVCCHRQDFHHEGEGYLPVQVGKALSSVDLGMQGDDEGDNISRLNPNYCELTALYWYWKNRPHARYVGLCHYRRYFDFAHPWLPLRSVRTVKASDMQDYDLSLPDMDRYMSGVDIVLPKRTVYPVSLRYDYAMYHIVNDIDILEQVIDELSPGFSAAYDKVIRRGHKLSHFNMFVTRREVFEDYCEWLFRILEEVQKRVCISGYKDQARIFGYLSERMLNVYVEARGLKVRYLPVIKVADEGQGAAEAMLTTVRNWIVAQFFVLPSRLRNMLSR